MGIKFRAMQAILYVCPVCHERFVGGETGVDEESAKWVNMHGDWHESQNRTDCPSATIRAVYGFAVVGI